MFLYRLNPDYLNSRSGFGKIHRVMPPEIDFHFIFQRTLQTDGLNSKKAKNTSIREVFFAFASLHKSEQRINELTHNRIGKNAEKNG